MKKIFSSIILIFMIIPLLFYPAKANSYYNCITGFQCDEGIITNASSGTVYGSVVTLEAQWAKLIFPQVQSYEYDGTSKTTELGYSDDGYNIVDENGQYADFYICPEGTTCTSTTQTEAGTYDLIITTKDATEALISDPEAKKDGVESATYSFYIAPFNITKATANTNINITDEGKYPGVANLSFVVKTTVNGSERTLTKGSDYMVYYNLKEGSSDVYEIKINGIGNYIGLIETQYTYQKRDLSELDFSVNDQVYTGAAIEPYFSIEDDGYTLQADTDYTVSFSNNTNVGTATIEVVGKGSYVGTLTKTFEITPKEFSVSEVDGYAFYNGLAQNGGAEVIVNDGVTGYTILYGTTEGVYNLSSVPTYIDAGEYTVFYKVSKDNYTAKEGTLKITIEKADNEISLEKNTYTVAYGSTLEIQPTISHVSTISVTSENSNIADFVVSGNKIVVTPKLVGSTEFTITVASDTNYNEVKVEATLIVNEAEITATTETISITYDGSYHSISYSVNPSDATTVFSWDEDGVNKTSKTIPKFKDAGTYIITYSASKVGYSDLYGVTALEINPKSIANINLSGTSFDYTGKEITPTVTVNDGKKVLTNNVDYIVEYYNNIMPGAASVKVTGIGNYKGSITQTFNINSLDISVKVINGEAQYTGYETSGVETKAEVIVEYPSSYNLYYSKTKPDCLSSNSCTDADYTETRMPKFKDVGTHTVYWRVSAPGYTAQEGTVNINITKRIVDTPEAFPSEGFIYTGQLQRPSWTNYNSKFMEISGDESAVAAGDYKVKFSILEKDNVEWSDGTTEDKEVTWSIVKISIKDHETISKIGVDYDEWKQLGLDDGKLTFDRTGYKQIGWVDDCTDTANDVLGISERECNYDTIYDVGSSVFGAYVADKIGFDEGDSYDLYAVWSNITYSIKYNLCDINGCGNFDSAVASVVGYDSPVVITDPIRAGYIFSGWEITGMDSTPHLIGYDTTNDTSYTTPEEWVGEALSCKNLTSIEGATVTFTAIWEPIKFNLNFDSNIDSYKDDDGELTTATVSGSVESMLVTMDEEFTMPENGYEVTGYEFDGWMLNPDWNDPGIIYEENETIDNIDFIDWDEIAKEHWTRAEIEDYLSNITLYAKWLRSSDTEFTVTYWKQRIGASDTEDSTNYEMVGKEVYTGETDRNITLTPYSYKESSESGETHSIRANISVVKNNLFTSSNFASGGRTINNYGTYAILTTDDYSNTSGLAATLNVGGIDVQTLTIEYNDKTIVLDSSIIGTDKASVQYYFKADGSYSKTANKKTDIFTLHHGKGNEYYSLRFFNVTQDIEFTINTISVESQEESTYSPNKTVSPEIKKQSTTNSSLSNNFFKGFTAPADIKVTILPNGSRNIDVYYKRNAYTITYYMNGGTTSNPTSRQYLVTVVFTDPIDGALASGTITTSEGFGMNVDEGGAQNSRKADFAGWFDSATMTTQIYEIDGEVIEDKEVWAKWLQYRYSGYDGEEDTWTSWGRGQ